MTFKKPWANGNIRPFLFSFQFMVPNQEIVHQPFETPSTLSLELSALSYFNSAYLAILNPTKSVALLPNVL